MSSNIESAEVAPQTVDEARHAVERSRQRISTTLDQLEEKIVEKKHELQDRADVLRPVREQVRERPFTAVAVGLGVGAVLGSLGGRDGDGSGDRGSRGGKRDTGLSRDERKELREWRRHRRDRLETRLGARDGKDAHDDGPGRLDAVKNQLMGAITSAIGAAVTAKVRELTGTGAASHRQGRDDGRQDTRRGY
ncbi:MAG TPA: hypothetical protein VK928_07530 [Longimicrobiales bacterium]|nr:hypothetical protein [Longimicrobiales bacterium]